MEKKVYSLSYAVRGRVVLKYFGQLCMVLAVIMLMALIFSFFIGEYTQSVRYIWSTLFIIVVGAVLNRIKASSHIQPNEALVISTLIFIFISLVAAYPMMGAGLSLEDALFEAVSAVTTTGLSTLSVVEDKPMSFLFFRSWMQWTGGLSIVVLTVALLVRPGMASKRLIEIEEKEDMITGTKIYARRVLIVYLIITFSGVIAMLLSGMELFSSVIHTLSAISTGGFSSYDNSLSGLTSWVSRGAVIAVSFLGSISMMLYYKCYRQGWRKFFGDIELKTLCLSALMLTLILSLFIGGQNGFSFKNTLGNAALMAFSAQTTTGFFTIDVQGLNNAVKLMMIIAMATGGCIGSTAGGFKIFRLLILLHMFRMTVSQTCMPPHAVVKPSLSGQRLGNGEIERSLLVILLFLVVIILSWLPFILFGYDSMDALFEVVSAVGTVGLSTGITNNDLPSVLKTILCVDMLMGRLEILAVLVIIYPGTWFGRRVETS